VKITAGQIRAARALLGLSQTDLAEHAGVSVPTVKRSETDAENSPKVAEPTRTMIIDALEGMGIEFNNGDAPGVRISKTKKGHKAR
jgi:transcriptional regulator with XRE-family HTH domain